jgi:hypothetical protein
MVDSKALLAENFDEPVVLFGIDDSGNLLCLGAGTDEDFELVFALFSVPHGVATGHAHGDADLASVLRNFVSGHTY